MIFCNNRTGLSRGILIKLSWLMIAFLDKWITCIGIIVLIMRLSCSDFKIWKIVEGNCKLYVFACVLIVVIINIWISLFIKLCNLHFLRNTLGKIPGAATGWYKTTFKYWHIINRAKNWLIPRAWWHVVCRIIGHSLIWWIPKWMCFLFVGLPLWCLVIHEHYFFGLKNKIERNKEKPRLRFFFLEKKDWDLRELKNEIGLRWKYSKELNRFGFDMWLWFLWSDEKVDNLGYL